MKNFFLLFIALGVLSSCGNESSIQNVEQDTAQQLQQDTLMVANEFSVDELIKDYFSKEEKFPLTMDSAYYEGLNTGAELLTGDQVRFLTQNFVETEFGGDDQFIFEDALTMDSLKAAGKYEEYVEKLDLAQLESANPYSVCRLQGDGGNILLIWFVDFATYPACPYYAGQSVFATVVKEGQVISSAMIGKDAGGGDAPYWSHEQFRTVLTVKGVNIEKISRSGGDEDEEGNEIVDEEISKSKLKIDANGTFIHVEVGG